MTEHTQMEKRFRGFLPVVVDVETGGFNEQTDALLQIAAVIIEMDEHGRLLCGETHSCHVNPFEGANLDPKSLEINGIDPDRIMGRVVELLDSLPIRGMDALHLASALWARDELGGALDDVRIRRNRRLAEVAQDHLAVAIGDLGPRSEHHVIERLLEVELRNRSDGGTIATTAHDVAHGGDDGGAGDIQRVGLPEHGDADGFGFPLEPRGTEPVLLGAEDDGGAVAESERANRGAQECRADSPRLDENATA